MRHHLKFKNFHRGTLSSTEELFKSGPWQGSTDDQQTKFERWVRQTSDVYELPVPSLEIEESTVGYDMGRIILNKFSVISLFHEFRHHMQFCGIGPFGDDQIVRELMEYDAIGWSCSLFYTVRPRSFRKAVREGRILYVSPEDLLATPPEEAHNGTT